MPGIASNDLGSVGGQGGDVTIPALMTGFGSSDYYLPFFHYLEIAKSTPKDTPTEYVLRLPVGVIRRVWVEFPRGCSGLAGVQVWRGVEQIFPLPAGVWLKSDNSVMSFAFTHGILSEPYEVVIKGYNEDDTYQHTIWLSFEMSGKPGDVPPQLLGLISYLKGK